MSNPSNSTIAPEPGEALGTAGRRVILLGLPLLVALTGLFQVRDLDVWWRIKTGEWIWSHGSIPESDPFSHASEGPWNCVEPAGNLFLFAVHAAFGPVGLSWAGAAMAGLVGLAAVVVARYAITKGPVLPVVFVAIGLFVSVSNFRFGPKPELFTLAGLACLLLLLHMVDRTRKLALLAWVPLLVISWAWLHRGAAVSIPVIGAAGVVWACQKETRLMALASLATLLVIMGGLELLPGTSGFLSSSSSVVSTSVYAKYVGEWRPLSLASVWSTMPLLPVMFLVWLMVAPVQRRLHFGTLVVLGLGFMAMRHTRFVPLVGLAMVPEIAWGLAAILDKHKSAMTVYVRRSARTGLLVTASVAVMATRYIDRPVNTWGPGVHGKLRPVRATEFLAKYPPPGRMFNTFNYGSYLLYKLGPETKVFIDGRNDQVYSPSFFEKNAVTPGNNEILAELIETYDIGYAVLQCTRLESVSYLWLYQNPEWVLVYLDDNTAIVVKRTPISEDYITKHGYQELRPDTALERSLRWHSDPRKEDFEKEVLRHVVEVPYSIRAHYLAATIHHQAGRMAAYAAERAKVAELAAARNVAVALP